MRRLVISIHDVHPSSFGAVQEQIAFCESFGVNRFSILLVPDFHRREPFDRCEELVGWLKTREANGDEIVVHGFYHMNDMSIVSPSSWFWNRIYTANEAEFTGLQLELARFRIQTGRQRLLDAGLHPVGFIPPAWLMSRDLPKAIFESGFAYTNTIDALITASGRTIRSRSLCYSARSGWRRHGSLAWNGLLWWLKEGNSFLRLSLHPGDLQHSRLRKQISAIVRQAIDINYTPTTYRDVVSSDN